MVLTETVQEAGHRVFAQRARRNLVRFVRNHPTGAIGGTVLIVAAVLVVLASQLAPFRYDRSVAQKLQGPMTETRQGERLWLGADEIGRDMLSRMLHGGRTSLFVGLAAPLLGIGMGTVLGIASAYYGGKTDLVVQRFVDVVITLPGLIVAMVVIMSLGFSMIVVIIALSITMSGTTVRVVRSLALSLTQTEYIAAARAIGASNLRVILRHLAPNTFAVSMVLFTVNVSVAITSEASLSFLGVGIQPPTPSWGNMLSTAQLYFQRAEHIALIPGIAITIVVFASNMFGDSLRDALDPRLRGQR